MGRKKVRRKKTVERTPEQIAMTCSTHKEARRYGEEVVMAFEKILFQKLISSGVLKVKDNKIIATETLEVEGKNGK